MLLTTLRGVVALDALASAFGDLDEFEALPSRDGAAIADLHRARSLGRSARESCGRTRHRQSTLTRTWSPTTHASSGSWTRNFVCLENSCAVRRGQLPRSVWFILRSRGGGRARADSP